MVIISALLCDKSGNLLLARQFQQVTTLQLKEVMELYQYFENKYVRNFPKLIQTSQQHTFIEHDNMRFIYSPLDQLYLLLITTKNSNIIEDLEVLRILNRLISEICVSVTIEKVKAQSFEILLAIDDVISAGIRESTSVSQVQAALEMESSEEKLHLMLMKARQNEANEIAKKHAIDIERKRQEELARKSKQAKTTNNAFTPQSPANVEQFMDQKPLLPKAEDSSQFNSAASVIKNSKTIPKKGMQLTKKKPETDNFLEQE